MNIATSVFPIAAVNQASAGSAKQNFTSGGDQFGSVFNSLIMNNNEVSHEQSAVDSAQLAEKILGIFNAETIEEIGKVLQTEKTDETLAFIQLPGVSDLLTIEDLAQLIGLESEELLKSVNLLLGENDSIEISNLNDLWSLIDQIEEIAPRFFDELIASLEGSGKISVEQASEVLAFLKVALLQVPKMDLHMNQEQQLFSLQTYVAAAGEQFNAHVNTTTTARPIIEQMLEAQQQVVRLALQTNTDQSSTKQDHSNEGNKESVVAGPVLGTVTTSKAEISLTELENRNNARNEALMREVQNIFKRSNFGQTGGTNRLLIKLYPEHLGQVRIELLQVNGVMTARILASTALGKSMLDSQLNQLRQAFVQQNLQVDRIDVSQTLQDTSRSDREHAFSQQFKKEQETAERQKQDDEEETTFQEYMIELEV